MDGCFFFTNIPWVTFINFSDPQFVRFYCIGSIIALATLAICILHYGQKYAHFGSMTRSAHCRYDKRHSPKNVFDIWSMAV